MGKLRHLREYKIHCLLNESQVPVFDTDFEKNLKNHIIDIIDLEEILEPGEKEPVGEDRIRYLTKIIQEEKGHEFGRVGRKRAIEDYLRGVPGTISLPFYDNKLSSFLYSLGVDNARDLDIDVLDKLMYGSVAEIINGYF
jgi:hypothetical protein